MEKPNLTTHQIVVNYGQSLEEMISASRYDEVDDFYIKSRNFSIKGEGVVNLEVVSVWFRRWIDSEEVVKEMAQMGLEPARIEHLVAYTAYCFLPVTGAVNCLGSSCNHPDGRSVPCFSTRNDGRTLKVRQWSNHKWSPLDHFLAIRKATA